MRSIKPNTRCMIIGGREPNIGALVIALQPATPSRKGFARWWIQPLRPMEAQRGIISSRIGTIRASWLMPIEGDDVDDMVETLTKELHDA